VADRNVIEHLRWSAPGHFYATSMAPPAVQQVISALQVIRGDDGTDRGARKIATLRDNSNYFRRRLLEMGCNVLGDWDSPVMVRCPGCLASACCVFLHFCSPVPALRKRLRSSANYTCHMCCNPGDNLGGDKHAAVMFSRSQ
jgi:hypothetical protein